MTDSYTVTIECTRSAVHPKRHPIIKIATYTYEKGLWIGGSSNPQMPTQTELNILDQPIDTGELLPITENDDNGGVSRPRIHLQCSSCKTPDVTLRGPSLWPILEWCRRTDKHMLELAWISSII